MAQLVLDRAAHRRRDENWLAEAWHRASILVIDPESGRVPVEGDPIRLAFVKADEAPDGERYFLGGEDHPYFAVAAPVKEGRDLRTIGIGLSELELDVLVVGAALVRWHAGHQFDSRSGRPTVVAAGGWERRDGTVVTWPSSDPAVMVLITDGADRCLLARGLGWAEGRFSCVAGFVEPGESIEAAAVREVGEEVGVVIDRLRYIASQPWPMPWSLMVAFEAVADPDVPIVVQEDEIAEARWFTRDEVASALAGDPAPFVLTQSISISRFLMERWIAQR